MKNKIFSLVKCSVGVVHFLKWHIVLSARGIFPDCRNKPILLPSATLLLLLEAKPARPMPFPKVKNVRGHTLGASATNNFGSDVPGLLPASCLARCRQT